jgi:hypothetical protein
MLGGVTMAFEGYATEASVPPGGTVHIHLTRDTAANFNVQVVRVSRAGQVMASGTGHVSTQAVPATAAETGAGWPTTYSVQVGANWPSGLYRAWFSVGADQAKVAFVVRPATPGSTSSILLEVTTTTEAAYNYWGGGSIYPSPGSPQADQRRRRVSLDRPPVVDPYSREEEFLLWMDDQDIPVEVCSGIDLHTGDVSLDPYALMLSVGHDEYWTKEMRDRVEAFIDGGGNVAFFSGNTSWWQVRLEDGNRTLVCYKSAFEDPMTGVDDSLVTVNWYDVPVNRPENAMTGVSFRNGAGRWVGGGNAAYTAVFPQHWVFESTGLEPGQTFAEGCVGYEADGAAYDLVQGVPAATGRDGSPIDLQILATADLSSWSALGQPGRATMAVFQRGGTVFTAATTDWTNGMDDSVVSQITRNVIDRLSALSPPDLWEQVGHAEDMVAMCGLHWFADLGPASGRFLFGRTGDNQLWQRTPTPLNVTWQPLGEANTVIAMAAIDARLYAIVSADGRIWQRAPVAGQHWTAMGAAPAGAVALAAMDGRLYAATSAGTLFRSVTAALAWQQIGTPGPVRAMAAAGGRLVALSTDDRLLSLDVGQANDWDELGPAPGMVTLAACDGRLWAADGGGRLWVRPPGALP